MIYGIEYSTDMRDRRTKVTKFRSIKRAVEWASVSGGYTHGEPVAAMNWHRTFRAVVETYDGWRVPSNAVLDAQARQRSTPTYPMTPNDVLADSIFRNGRRIHG